MSPFRAMAERTGRLQSSAKISEISSFREWQISLKLVIGEHELKVRATSNDGKVQPMEALWNSAGYLRNVVETTRVTAA